MVGQPKLEWIENNHLSKTNLFNNDNPVFYFNPHWDMQLSSYLGWRDVVLDFFRKHKSTTSFLRHILWSNIYQK